MEGVGLTREQVGAIRFSIKIGKTLQKDLPEIAEDYRAGKVIREIVEERDIISNYGIQNPETARYAVWLALHGYSGKFNFIRESPYEGLVPEEELQVLVKENMERTRAENGLINKLLNVGYCGLPFEQRSAAGKVGEKFLEKDYLNKEGEFLACLKKKKQELVRKGNLLQQHNYD